MFKYRKFDLVQKRGFILCCVVCVLQLLDTYIMTSRDLSLNTAACRLLQNIVPGLETAVVFQEKVKLEEKVELYLMSAYSYVIVL